MHRYDNLSYFRALRGVLMPQGKNICIFQISNMHRFQEPACRSVRRPGDETGGFIRSYLLNGGMIGTFRPELAGIRFAKALRYHEPLPCFSYRISVVLISCILFQPHALFCIGFLILTMVDRACAMCIPHCCQFGSSLGRGAWVHFV